nr:PREDICTED: dentin sialophosphoprotein-like isoform X2 [Bemisia tabaci]
MSTSTSRTTRSKKADVSQELSPQTTGSIDVNSGSDSGVRTSSRLRNRTESMSSLIDEASSTLNTSSAKLNSLKEIDENVLTQSKRSSSRLSQNLSQENVTAEQGNKRCSSRSSKISEAVTAEDVPDNAPTTRSKRSSSRLSQTSVASDNTDGISLSQQGRRSSSRTAKILDAVENVLTPPTTRSSSRLSQISEAESTESLSNITTRRYGTRSRKTDSDTNMEIATSGRRSSSRLSQLSDSSENLSVIIEPAFTRSLKQNSDKGPKEKVISEVIDMSNVSEKDTPCIAIKETRENKRESKRLSVRGKSTLEDIQEVQDEIAPTRRSTRLRRDSESTEKNEKSTPVKIGSRKSIMCSTLQRIPDEDENKVGSSPEKKNQIKETISASEKDQDTAEENGNVTEPDGIKSSVNQEGANETSKSSDAQLYSLISLEISRASSSESLMEAHDKSESKSTSKKRQGACSTALMSERNDIQIKTSPARKEVSSPVKQTASSKEINSEINDIQSKASPAKKEGSSPCKSFQRKQCDISVVDCNKKSTPKKSERTLHNSSVCENSTHEMSLSSSDTVVQTKDAVKQDDLADLKVSAQTDEVLNPAVSSNDSHLLSDQKDDEIDPKYSKDKPSAAGSKYIMQNSPKRSKCLSVATYPLCEDGSAHQKSETFTKLTLQETSLCCYKLTLDGTSNESTTQNQVSPSKNSNIQDKIALSPRKSPSIIDPPSPARKIDSSLGSGPNKEFQEKLNKTITNSTTQNQVSPSKNSNIQDKIALSPRKSLSTIDPPSPARKIDSSLGSGPNKEFQEKLNKTITNSTTQNQVSPSKNSNIQDKIALSPRKSLSSVDPRSPARKIDSSLGSVPNKETKMLAQEKLDATQNEPSATSQIFSQSETEKKSSSPMKKALKESDPVALKKIKKSEDSKNADSKHNKLETASDKSEITKDDVCVAVENKEKTNKLDQETELKNHAESDDDNLCLDGGSDSDDPELLKINFSEDGSSESSDDSSKGKEEDQVPKIVHENEDIITLDTNNKSQTAKQTEEISELDKANSVDSDDDVNYETSINNQSVVVLNKEPPKNKRVSFSNDVKEPKKSPKKSTLLLLSDPDYVSKIQNYISNELQSRQQLKQISKLNNPKIVKPSKKVDKPIALKKEKPKPLEKPVEHLSKKIKIDEVPKCALKMSSKNTDQTSSSQQPKPIASKAMERKKEPSKSLSKKQALTTDKFSLKPVKPSNDKFASSNAETLTQNVGSSHQSSLCATSNSDQETNNFLTDKSKNKRKVEENTIASALKKAKLIQNDPKFKERAESFPQKSKKSNNTAGHITDQSKQKVASTMNFQVTIGKTKPIFHKSLPAKQFTLSALTSSQSNEKNEAKVIPASWGKILVENNHQTSKISLKSTSADAKNKWEVKPSKEQPASTFEGKKVDQTASASTQAHISDRNFGKKNLIPVPAVTKVAPQVPTKPKPELTKLSVANKASGYQVSNISKKKKKKKSKSLSQDPTEVMKNLADSFVQTAKKPNLSSKSSFNWPTNDDGETIDENDDVNVTRLQERKTSLVQLKDQNPVSNSRKLSVANVFQKQKVPTMSIASDSTSQYFKSFDKKKHGDRFDRKRKLLTTPGSELPKPAKSAHLEPVKGSQDSEAEPSSNSEALKTLPEDFLKKLSHRSQLLPVLNQDNHGKKKRKKNKKKKNFQTSEQGGASSGLDDDFIPLSGCSTKFKVVALNDTSKQSQGISHSKNKFLQRRDTKREPVQNILKYRQKMSKPEKTKWFSTVS